MQRGVSGNVQRFLRELYGNLRPCLPRDLQILVRWFVQRFLRRNLYAFLRENVFRVGELGDVGGARFRAR